MDLLESTSFVTLSAPPAYWNVVFLATSLLSHGLTSIIAFSFFKSSLFQISEYCAQVHITSAPTPFRSWLLKAYTWLLMSWSWLAVRNNGIFSNVSARWQPICRAYPSRICLKSLTCTFNPKLDSFARKNAPTFAPSNWRPFLIQKYRREFEIHSGTDCRWTETSDTSILFTRTRYATTSWLSCASAKVTTISLNLLCCLILLEYVLTTHIAPRTNRMLRSDVACEFETNQAHSSVILAPGPPDKCRHNCNVIPSCEHRRKKPCFCSTVFGLDFEPNHLEHGALKCGEDGSHIAANVWSFRFKMPWPCCWAAFESTIFVKSNQVGSICICVKIDIDSSIKLW